MEGVETVCPNQACLGGEDTGQKRSESWEPGDEWEAKGREYKATHEPHGASRHDSKTHISEALPQGKNFNMLTFRRIWGGVA